MATHEASGHAHISPYQLERLEIIEGLKRWALGSYPEQTAVLFLAATNEPLTRVWVQRSDAYSDGPRYWLNWDTFNEHGGVLSGGEWATWALARSLCSPEGELYQNLWRMDPARGEAFAAAIVRSRENWR